MVTSEVSHFIIELPIYKKRGGVMNTFANMSLNFYTSTHSKLHQCFNCFN